MDEDAGMPLLENDHEQIVIEEEEELVVIERIRGDYNMEIPEVLHCVFHFLSVRDLLLLSRVSRTFRRVATTDLLWGHIISNLDDYFPSKNQHARMVFFYDLRKKKENLHSQMIKKFQKARLRTIRYDKKIRYDSYKHTAGKFAYKTWSVTLWIATVFTTIVLPPIGIVGQGIISTRKIYYNENNQYDEFGVLFGLNVCDTICCCFATCILTLLGFIPGVICGVLNFFVCLGKFYYNCGGAEGRGQECLLFLSPSMICIMTFLCCGISVVSVILGCIFFGVACMEAIAADVMRR